MTNKEAVQMALDALEFEASGWEFPPTKTLEAIEILRARLAQQQNEDECRRTCKALCAGTGDTGGDWPCVKQRG